MRKCVIYYYLTDGSIQVDEPKDTNSGIPQGAFLKRHLVPLSATGGDVTAIGPPSSRGGFVGIGQLRVGASLELYGRTFHLVSCDAFTRNFLEARGVEVPQDIAYPEAPMASYLARRERTVKAAPKGDYHSRFFTMDRKVLRFYVVWDDRERLYGDKHKYVLNYYLSDDTAEVLEVHDPRSGRDPFPKLLQRMRVPRKPTASSAGVQVDESGRNLFAPAGPAFISEKDLFIGASLQVYARTFYLYDCDAFTREYLKSVHGYTDADVAPQNVVTRKAALPRNELPPWKGGLYGGEEDSRQNCLSIQPKPKRGDFHKQMENAGTTLRFTSILASGAGGKEPSVVDKGRVFIITYYLENDTMAIFEPPVKNSGLWGGKYLERQPVFHPGSTTQRYAPTDLCVGAKIVVFGRTFELGEADEFTLRYMEERPKLFPGSDLEAVVDKAKEAFSADEASVRSALLNSADELGRLGTAELGSALAGVGVAMSTQEALTLSRKLDVDAEGTVAVADVINLISL